VLQHADCKQRITHLNFNSLQLCFEHFLIDDRNVLSGSAMKVMTFKAFFKYFGLSSGISTAREKIARKLSAV
jgi:hypothetical protein